MPDTESTDHKGEERDKELDSWILGNEKEIAEPPAVIKIQILAGEFVKANNTRYLVKQWLRVGKDLNDQEMITKARSDGRRARALMEDSISRSKKLLESLPIEDRKGILDQLPKEFAEAMEPIGVKVA